jgi:hypothetical protein
MQLKDIIDNKEIEEITSILEELEDEELAVGLLREFNEKSRALGLLLMNRDPDLEHDEWKKQCDQALLETKAIIKTIREL